MTRLIALAALIPLPALLAAAPQSNVRFEPNRGQAPGGAPWIARSGQYSMLLEDGGALVLGRAGSGVRLTLDGAGRQLTFRGEDPQPGVSHYFRGSNPSQWRLNVPHYGRLRVSGVYPGIDLLYYAKGSRIEYDFLVSPGADASRIALRVDGARSLRVDEAGDLEITAAGGVWRQHKPRVFQEAGGERVEVGASYRLRHGKVTFALARYDKRAALRIDPVISYATYAGGAQTDDGRGVAVDGQGNFYLCGKTESADFPLLTPFDGAIGANDDEAFVMKFNAGGTLLYATYLGGSGDDEAQDIVADAAGNVYVAGKTRSANFPVASPLFPTMNGALGDAFVAKLNPAGNALVFSTFLGGLSAETANGIALDAAGNVYVCGQTSSPDFPTTPGSHDTVFSSHDAFVTKLNPAGSAMVYSTYLGGSGMDEAADLAVDGAGNVYVAGTTFSTDFPTSPGAYQRTFGGFTDAFLSKLNSAGTALVFSTYLGGTNNESAHDVALDSLNRPHIAGETWSSNFPATPGALDTTYTGLRNGFVARFNSSGTTLLYSSYIGGSQSVAGGVRVFPSGHFAVTGTTGEVPVTGDAPRATRQGASDMFLSVFQPSGAALQFSTYLGGFPADGEAVPLEIDAAQNVYVAGASAGAEVVPVTANALDQTQNGSWDAVLLKLTGFNLGAGAACTGSVAASAQTFAAAGGAGLLTLVPASNCNWFAEASPAFLQLTGAAGTGPGTANLTVAPNGGTAARFGTVSALGRILHITQAGTTTVAPFDDVPLNDPYVNHIAEMKSRGITSGCGGNNYCPVASTTRGQMAVFIIRALLGDTFPFPAAPYFADVPATHAYFKYIQKMRELGITSGCSATDYCPDATVTRGQMAVFMIRARLGNLFPPATTPDFDDVAPNDPYRQFINKMREVGITTGCTASTYCPGDPITRGQMAVFLIRAFFSAW